LTFNTFTGLAARPAIKAAGGMQCSAQQSLGTAEATTTNPTKSSPVDFNMNEQAIAICKMIPGAFVIIVASRLNPAAIGARVDRVSPASDMIYLTDIAGNDRVCFTDELAPTDQTFDIKGGPKQGQSQDRRVLSHVDYKAAAAKRAATIRERNPDLLPLLEAAKRIGVAKALLSRAGKLGEMKVERNEFGRAIGVTMEEAQRWAKERNRKPGPKRPNATSSPAAVGAERKHEQ